MEDRPSPEAFRPLSCAARGVWMSYGHACGLCALGGDRKCPTLVGRMVEKGLSRPPRGSSDGI